jgi:hypothetical protein
MVPVLVWLILAGCVAVPAQEILDAPASVEEIHRVEVGRDSNLPEAEAQRSEFSRLRGRTGDAHARPSLKAAACSQPSPDRLHARTRRDAIGNGVREDHLHEAQGCDVGADEGIAMIDEDEDRSDDE